MNKAELQVYVRNNTGLEMDSMNSMNELEQAKLREGIVAKLWHKCRKWVILASNIFRIAPKARTAVNAIIAVLDAFYGDGKTKPDGDL